MTGQQGSVEAGRRRKTRWIAAAAVVLVAAAAAYFWWARSRPATTVQIPVPRGGGYADLAPEQKRLVDDWVERFDRVMGAQVTAEEHYGNLALSTRTTFNAVTHALRQTKLTDSAGQPMNLTALDLVARVETVAGKMPGKGGDKQFRMYVELKPGAQDNLEKSREFSRQVDNTVFHKGYPTCFRGSGGTPSIQISLSRDTKRGDVDVDYRSSSFPIMLVNGHLTASNSDVRAGDNDQRHNGRWSGLANWWRAFMGLPLIDAPIAEGAAVGAPVASEPRLGKGARPEQAIHDFLNAWLVEQNPAVAVGYVSPRAFACMELERGVPVDRGLARFQLFRAMQTAAGLAGRAGSLSGVIGGVQLSNPRARVMEQPHNAEFVMYDVREDLAAQLDCEIKLHPEQADPKKAASTDFGEYVGAVFQLKTPALKGETVATVWAEEKSGWTLVSYDVEPEASSGTPASAPPPSAPVAPALPVVEGNAALERSVKSFLDSWFVKKDAAAAFRHLSTKSFPCYNVFRAENLPQAASDGEAGKLIEERMNLLADWAGTGDHLSAILAAVEPHHSDLKLVKHDEAAAFSIVSVPDYMGAAADCSKLKRAETPRFDRPGPNTHGRFYAASTRLKRAGEDAAVLWTVWAREGPAWKVVSYLVVTP